MGLTAKQETIDKLSLGEEFEHQIVSSIMLYGQQVFLMVYSPFDDSFTFTLAVDQQALLIFHSTGRAHTMHKAKRTLIPSLLLFH
jgi:hypothetical protein